MLRRKNLILVSLQLKIALYTTWMSCLGIILSRTWDYVVEEPMVLLTETLEVSSYYLLIGPVIAIMISCYWGLILTNRFAGPIYRLNNHMEEVLEKGRATTPLAFRKGDYFHELAQNYTKLLERDNRGVRADKSIDT